MSEGVNQAGEGEGVWRAGPGEALGCQGLYARTACVKTQRGGMSEPQDAATSWGIPSGIVTMPTIRNLDHSVRVGVKRKLDAARSVQDLGTTAKGAHLLGNPEWLADLEYVWRSRTHDELQRLHKRARAQGRAARAAERPVDRVRLSRSAEWAEHRAQSMALPRAEVVAACETRWRKVGCGCGVQEVKVGCDQVQLCPRCAKRHWRRWRKRITRAMDSHVRAARGAWSRERRGMCPGVYLITLTIPHSGSIVVDRETIGKGWRELTKRASAGNWWGAYALTYEVTPGRDGLGHVHAHVAVVSSWVPYDELHAAWTAITGAVVLDVSPPRSGKACKTAADYLAKYVTKGVDPSVFTGQKAGELLAAMRGKRRVTTSVGFWRPTKERETLCPTCGQKHRALGAPPSLRSVAPGPVLRAMAERIGFFVPRGAIQSALTLPGP